MTALAQLSTALSQVVIGQPAALEDVITALVARGHVLLEGVPGVAKTLLARSLAGALGRDFRRVQLLPDLMPSDVLGTQVFRPADGSFSLVKGPIFTEVLLADEINRTPPKTQSALLEAMEERQVTIDGQTHALSPRFFVVATQNPVELEGTYPLPEAQLDRFLMRVSMGYPSAADELRVLERFHTAPPGRHGLAPVLTGEALDALVTAAHTARCDASVLKYVLEITRRTRELKDVRLGASPRAAQALLAASKARATLSDRDFVVPDDVKRVAPAVLTHRLALSPEALAEGVLASHVVARLLDAVEVPR